MTKPNSPVADQTAAVIEWIDAHQPLLIVTHTRPDGDALGSLFGAWLALRTRGIECTPYVCEPVPETYVDFAPEELVVGDELDPEDFRGLLCLDCANPSRLGIPPNLDYRDLPLAACNIDHHVDNHRYGEINLVDGSAAATAEVLTELFDVAGLQITAECATQLLIGIITDTGGFKHGNTDPQVLRAAARLIECGGDYQQVIMAAYYSESPGMIKLKGHITENLRFAFDERLVYFTLTPKMLETYGIDERDTEDLIDVARTMRGVQIVCRMQQVAEGVRYSFRSQNPALHVNTIAHKLNGGGHPMAAGALMKGIDVKEAEALLLEHVGALLNG